MKHVLAAVAVVWMVLAGSPRATGGEMQATHKEVQPIGAAGEGKIGQLSTLCVTGDDRLLACDWLGKDVKVFDLSGKLLGKWALPFEPSAICCCVDGTIYVGGAGKLARLDKTGKVLQSVDVPDTLTSGAPGGGRGAGRPAGKASGMAADDKDLFVSFGTGWSLRSTGVIVRFDRGLGSPVRIAQGLHGCCQRLDLVEKDGVLYVAENTRYRVLKLDRDGKELGSWGKRSRDEVEGFGSCCNPMNLCFGPGGVLYTAESGLGRVKRYTTEGKLLSLVGEVGVTRFTTAGGLAASCSNIAVAASSDESRVFVQDVKINAVRVLQKP